MHDEKEDRYVITDCFGLRRGPVQQQGVLPSSTQSEVRRQNETLWRKPDCGRPAMPRYLLRERCFFDSFLVIGVLDPREHIRHEGMVAEDAPAREAGHRVGHAESKLGSDGTKQPPTELPNNHVAIVNLQENWLPHRQNPQTRFFAPKSSPPSSRLAGRPIAQSPPERHSSRSTSVSRRGP